MIKWERENNGHLSPQERSCLFETTQHTLMWDPGLQISQALFCRILCDRREKRRKSNRLYTFMSAAWRYMCVCEHKQVEVCMHASICMGIVAWNTYVHICKYGEQMWQLGRYVLMWAWVHLCRCLSVCGGVAADQLCRCVSVCISVHWCVYWLDFH